MPCNTPLTSAAFNTRIAQMQHTDTAAFEELDIAVDKTVSVHVRTWGSSTNPCVVCLHGFMQTGAAWSEVAAQLGRSFYVVVPDLAGHGATHVPLEEQHFTFEALMQQLDTLIERLGGRVSLLGYSLGGRIAATYTVAHPGKVRCLVLESAGLGPVTEQERQQRQLKTQATVQHLQTNTLPEFVDFWQQLPLFESQRALSNEIQATVRQQRLANNPPALALITEHAGQHRMENLRTPLVASGVPVLYLAGELDAAYTKVARSLMNECALHNSDATTLEVGFVPGAGHNIHLENPDAFTQRVAPFLSVNSIL